MGLDQYLRAKSDKLEAKRCRGACGGLFPLGPADNGTTEIGYWRKAYEVSEYLRDKLGVTGDYNLVDIPVAYKDVVDIVNCAKNTLERKAYKDEYEKSDWEDTVEAFTKAKEILESDPDAQIFYMEWF